MNKQEHPIKVDPLQGEKEAFYAKNKYWPAVDELRVNSHKVVEVVKAKVNLDSMSKEELLDFAAENQWHDRVSHKDTKQKLVSVLTKLVRGNNG